MVEDNAHKKRRGLFGSRRTTRKAPTLRTAPSAPVATESEPSTDTLQHVDAPSPSTDPATAQAPATVPNVASEQNQDTTVTDIVSPDTPTDQVVTAAPVRRT